MKKETFEVELFIHKRKCGEGFDVYSCDMSDYGSILLGTQTVTLNTPIKDPVEAEIEMLDKKEASLVKNHNLALHAISERKSQLLCIENLQQPADVLADLDTKVNE